MFSEFLNHQFLSIIYQFFLSLYFLYYFVAEFIINIVLLIYKTILRLYVDWYDFCSSKSFAKLRCGNWSEHWNLVGSTEVFERRLLSTISIMTKYYNHFLYIGFSRRSRVDYRS